MHHLISCNYKTPFKVFTWFYDQIKHFKGNRSFIRYKGKKIKDETLEKYIKRVTSRSLSVLAVDKIKGGSFEFLLNATAVAFVDTKHEKDKSEVTVLPQKLETLERELADD